MSEDEHFRLTMEGKSHQLLMRSARMLLPKGKRKTMPNWVLAMNLFMVGSTYGWRICKEACIDPDGFEA